MGKFYVVFNWSIVYMICMFVRPARGYIICMSMIWRPTDVRHLTFKMAVIYIEQGHEYMTWLTWNAWHTFVSFFFFLFFLVRIWIWRLIDCLFVCLFVWYSPKNNIHSNNNTNNYRKYWIKREKWNYEWCFIMIHANVAVITPISISATQLNTTPLTYHTQSYC